MTDKRPCYCKMLCQRFGVRMTYTEAYEVIDGLYFCSNKCTKSYEAKNKVHKNNVRRVNNQWVSDNVR